MSPWIDLYQRCHDRLLKESHLKPKEYFMLSHAYGPYTRFDMEVNFWFLLKVKIWICVTYIVLFVGPAIRSGSFFYWLVRHMGPQFNWGGAPKQELTPEKAMEAMISISDLIQRGGGGHMFSIWTYAWLPPSPAKHNLYPPVNRVKYVCRNISFAKKKDLWGRLIHGLCSSSWCVVPGQDIEQLKILLDICLFSMPFTCYCENNKGKK